MQQVQTKYCPVCGGPLHYRAPRYMLGSGTFTCWTCGYVYREEEKIPIFIEMNTKW
jgi:uncharacterized protein YbaR (Trm112 family)